MEFDKLKIMAMSQPMSESDRSARDKRRQERHVNAASAAISAKVLRQLKILGMTRVDLAEKLKVSPANITRYLNGRCNFELRTLVELERALDIHIIDRDVIPTRDIKPIKIVLEYKHSIETDGKSYCAGHIDNDVFAKMMNYG